MEPTPHTLVAIGRGKMRLFEHIRDALRVSGKDKASIEWEYVGYVKMGNEGERLEKRLKYHLDEGVISSFIKRLSYSDKPAYINGKIFRYKGMLKSRDWGEHGYKDRLTFDIYRAPKKSKRSR